MPLNELLNNHLTTARRAAEKLTLPLRQGMQRSSGNVPGANAGSSIDFQDHRPYVPGDDPRHIDWQAYARSGHYTMKLYREEIRPLVDLALDVSSSMSLLPEKANRSIELATFCIECTLRNSGSLQMFTLSGEEVRRVDPQEPLSFDREYASNGPSWTHIPWRQGSLRVVISDLLDPAEPALAPLLVSGGRAIIFAPFTQEERNPDWLGNTEVVDCETQERSDHYFRGEDLDRYRLAYRRHFENWEHEARRHGVPLARIPSSPEFLESLGEEALSSGAVVMAS